MLKVYLLICISVFISAYGNKYTIREMIGNFAFIGQDNNGTKVAIKVYDVNRFNISLYMKPDNIQIKEIAQVIYDAPCVNEIKTYNLSTYFVETIKKSKCIITKYYSYKENIHDLKHFIVEYNMKHTEDNENNKEIRTLDSVFDTIFMKILSGLEYLHDPKTRTNKETQPVMHMDIKPENIFITSDPQTNELECKLGDFEYSSFGTISTDSSGTPHYYDPRRADVFLKSARVNEGISKFYSTSTGSLVVCVCVFGVCVC
eukprot:GHVR01144113.1.p1 GENE.GHVR01144113.1~~GHVR01144113.1.p1  ORF type:complete len:259 (+),score=57.52 GHVR01144113.1:28-804(+)